MDDPGRFKGERETPDADAEESASGGRSEAPESARRKPYATPALRRIEQGTDEHRRAQAAFEELRENDAVASLQAPDRRGSKRAVAIFRPAILQVGDHQEFCLVRNISTTGLMASIHSQRAPGEMVEFHLSEMAHVSGQVVWSEGDRIGVEFASPVSVGDLLTALASQSRESTTYRSPRLQVSSLGKFIFHSEIQDLEVMDISQRGLKARKLDLKEGDEGVVALPGLEPRRAVVRWSRDGVAGLYFLEPIGFSELGRWVIAHSSEKRTEKRTDAA